MVAYAKQSPKLVAKIWLPNLVLYQTVEEVDKEGQPCAQMRSKEARLVVQGFEEDTLQLCRNCTDSPTRSKNPIKWFCISLLLTTGSWRWSKILNQLICRVNPVSRDLSLHPPKCAKTDKLWKLKKTPYRLVDAGCQWYISVVMEFTALVAHLILKVWPSYLFAARSIGFFVSGLCR